VIYLYLKTHNKTGFKYLGKTVSNPETYKGSGKIWRRHLNKHGDDVSTQILAVCQTKNELREAGLYYSALWNIVESTEFANLMPEMGDGGATRVGFKHPEETLEKLRQPKNDTKNMKLAQQRLASVKSEEQKKWHANPANLNKKITQITNHCHSEKARKKRGATISQLKWCNDGKRNYRLKDVPKHYSIGRIG